MTARASDPLPLRPQISESWQRSVARGISAHLPASPSVLTDADLQRRRSGHPLDRVRPLLEDVLGEAVRDCEAVLALGDAEGHLLWITGPRTALRRAERIGFVPGSNWDERALGTNAPGTALRLDTALAVRGAEHYLDAIRSWSCAATPIHHPTTGAVLGVLDVTGGRQVALPQTLAMVRAAARMAEAELARTLATLPSRPPTGEPADFTLDVLGRAEALLRSGADRTQPIRLGQRHAEMLVLLGTHPAGLTGDELAELVYPHPVSPTTIRAEVNRLRTLLGPGVLESRPYRLRATIRGDWCTVGDLLAAGDVEAAVHAYPGRLLPRSSSPAIEALGEELEASLRAAVLGSGRPDLMAAWTRTEAGADDLPMWIAQHRFLATDAPQRAWVAARVARLEREYAPPRPVRRR